MVSWPFTPSAGERPLPPFLRFSALASGLSSSSVSLAPNGLAWLPPNGIFLPPLGFLPPLPLVTCSPLPLTRSLAALAASSFAGIFRSASGR